MHRLLLHQVVGGHEQANQSCNAPALRNAHLVLWVHAQVHEGRRGKLQQPMLEQCQHLDERSKRAPAHNFDLVFRILTEIVQHDCGVLLQLFVRGREEL